ncbi:MAG TPA: peptidoglycan DD-metalloendopeptidase family protein [Rhizomicrobium sp.]|nr:peptidoglycan DD-metalloendopeptidase family protein [Rhizomicrobium sp.]
MHHPQPQDPVRVIPVQATDLKDIEPLIGAVPARDAKKLPTTADQYRTLKQQIDKNRPAVESAKQRSDLLNKQAADLRRRLDDTTAHVQALEIQKGAIDAELARLVPEERAMAQTFANDRAEVSHLLAVLERLQSDMPPVLAIKADDALSAARGAMVLGGTLPRIYQAAAALAERLRALRLKQAELTKKRQDGIRVGAKLANARSELDQLLAIKSQEADQANAQYGDLEARLSSAADAAASLQTLLDKVAALRMKPAGQGIVTVSALNTSNPSVLRRHAIVKPVTGAAMEVGVDGVGGARAPGVTFLAPPGAEVVSPSDGEVLFAGSYHKTGKVLILEMGGGYDLVLAGLDTVDVRPGDELLAGEPVGAMPRAGAGSRLYFELRQNGKGVNPAPWMEVDLRKAKRS